MHTIRSVRSKDYYKIKKLQLKNNLKTLDFKSWNKLWTKSPLKDETRGWLIENKNEIVGYLGNIIREYKINNKIIRTACSHSFVVKKEYRYLSFILLRKFFSQKNILLFLNTSSNKEASKIWIKLNAKKIPLNNSTVINFLPLNLKQITKAYFKKKNIYINKFYLNSLDFILRIFFFKKINLFKKIKFYNEIKLISKINKKFNLFFNKYNKKLNKIISNNNQRWLSWLYNNKIKKKEAWIYVAYKNSKITGYACCIKKYNKISGIKKVLLTKLFALENDNNILKKLISNCIIEAQKRKYHVIEYIGFDKTRNDLLELFGSLKRSFINYPLYYKTYDLKLDKFLKNTKSWELGFDDGDNFV